MWCLHIFLIVNEGYVQYVTQFTYHFLLKCHVNPRIDAWQLTETLNVKH